MSLRKIKELDSTEFSQIIELDAQSSIAWSDVQWKGIDDSYWVLGPKAGGAFALFQFIAGDTGAQLPHHY